MLIIQIKQFFPWSIPRLKVSPVTWDYNNGAGFDFESGGRGWEGSLTKFIFNSARGKEQTLFFLFFIQSIIRSFKYTQLRDTVLKISCFNKIAAYHIPQIDRFWALRTSCNTGVNNEYFRAWIPTSRQSAVMYLYYWWQRWDLNSMLSQCCASIANAGPALRQRWANVPYFVGMTMQDGRVFLWVPSRDRLIHTAPFLSPRSPTDPIS